MLFRQLFDSRSSTFTYLLADASMGVALLIDPVFEQVERDAALVRELGLVLRFTLETHVHADHVTAAWLLRERFDSAIVASASAGADGADRLVRDGDAIAVGSVVLEARATPGHTSGCVTYVAADRSMAFTGDALLIRGAGRTDFQGGDARTLYRSVHAKIFSLPDDTLLYPGHDYAGRSCTSVGEERRLNPRLGGDRSEDDFVGFMTNLGLPHPRQMTDALPANLRSGRPERSPGAASPATWAPVVRTFAGVPELTPEWVAEHAGEVRVIDVREPREWDGELGHIELAELVPLGTLRAACDAWDRRGMPLVTVCRSGGRSAQASLILESAGFSEVANLAGGMIRWKSLRLPVVRPPRDDSRA